MITPSDAQAEITKLRKELAECEQKAAASEATDRYIASGVGGAFLGASGFGPLGAIVGAIIGIALAWSIKRRTNGHTGKPTSGVRT